MKTSIFVLGALVFFLSASFVNAEVPLKDYERMKDQEYFKTYIDGVGVGLSWANEAPRSGNCHKLYCQPGKLALHVENLLRILDDEIERGKDIYKMNTPVELILLKGLEHTFPCK